MYPKLMVRNYSSENGSIFGVVVIVLVVAIIGALGFALWKNHANTNDQVMSNITKTEPIKDGIVKVERLSKSYTIPKEDISFSYPETWELRAIHTNQEGSVGDNRVLLISPRNFALTIGVPSDGASWPFGDRPLACPFDEGYSGYEGGDDNHPDACPYYKELFSEGMPNLQDLSIMAFESSWETKDIAPNMMSLLLVKTGCKIPENGHCERPSAKTGFYLNVQGGFYQRIGDEEKNIALVDTSFTNHKQIEPNDFIESPDVLTAISILKSLKY